MKKTLLITLAVVLILVGGIWLYLFIFGAPESSRDLFADLGFGSSPAPLNTGPLPNTFTPPNTTQTGTDTAQALRLLTLRPVAGAVIIGTSTYEQIVRYVERGTGQIQEIDLQTGEEKTIVDDSIPQTLKATWSNDGSQVVIVSGNSLATQVQLLTQQPNSDSDSDSPETVRYVSSSLPPDSYDFSFSKDGSELQYLRTDTAGTLGYSYNTNTNKASVLFDLPFIAPKVQWGRPTLVYNRPGENQLGYAYHVSNGQLTSAGPGGDSLVAVQVHNSGTLISNRFEGIYRGTFHAEDSSFDVAIPALPEKCTTAAVDDYILYCAYPITVTGNIPTDWYKGVVSLQDYLWKVNVNPNDPERGTAALVADFTKESGQSIDSIDMNIDTTNTRLLFTNKHSYSLWMYDTNLTETTP